ARRALRLRWARQGAVLFEADQNRDPELVGIGGAGRRIPALAQSRSQRIELALRQPRCLTRRGAERERVIDGVARRRDALRITLVEQRGDAVRVEFRL